MTRKHQDLNQYCVPAPDQVIAHTNLYWRWQSAPGRRGRTVDTAEVTFAGATRAGPSVPDESPVYPLSRSEAGLDSTGWGGSQSPLSCRAEP